MSFALAADKVTVKTAFTVPLFPSATVTLSMEIETALQSLKGELLLRGWGGPLVKSAVLLSVSVQPSRARKAAVLLVNAGSAGPAPSKQKLSVAVVLP